MLIAETDKHIIQGKNKSPAVKVTIKLNAMLRNPNRMKIA